MPERTAVPMQDDTDPPLQRPGDAANIAVSLRRQIVSGKYAHGERLPAERALATHFHASRGTIRAALRDLEETGLVTRRLGSGTYVRYRYSVETDDIAERTSPVELMEVRAAVEPHMVRLAIMNATARDLRRLGATLRQVEACADPERFSRADEAFHLALADCSRNPLMLKLYRLINEVRRHSQWNVRKDKILTPTRIAEYNRQHRRLFQTVQGRDMAGAVKAITTHLAEARADLLGTAQDE